MNTSIEVPVAPTTKPASPPLEKQTTVGNYFVSNYPPYSFWKPQSVPDFLAVRGLATIVLMGAMPLLDAGYMNFEHVQIHLYKIAVYLAIAGAIWLGAQPWRLRDFFGWLFAQPGRTRGVGGAMTGYGVLLAIVAFTY